MERLWIGLGALAGFLAVAASAIAAHAVPDPAAHAMAASAAQMLGWHALALFGVGLWAARGGMLAHLAGAAFGLGLLAFCGTVFARAFTGLHTGPLAPIGGTTLMLGWLLLGVSALRAR